MKGILIVVILAGVLTAGASPVLAQAPGKPVQLPLGGSTLIDVAGSPITSNEIAIIRDFIDRHGFPGGDEEGHGKNKGKGKNKYKPLPPGIKKNLARGKPLPPGIAKTRFPDGLLGQLPGRTGYDWIFVDRDVVLIEAATQLIVDLVRDVF